ncbi:MAG TPA: hypothetical protein VH062_33405 [Polyangiaceae bacterium]|nr:hypothetical protein [Polyangiaceae bacterium]
MTISTDPARLAFDPAAAAGHDQDFTPSRSGGPKATFALGVAAGWVMAPLFGLVSFARQARTFHPRGPTFHAVVTRHTSTPASLELLADRLVGHALVRFSGALWKNSENIPDVLGCALRFRRTDENSAEASPGDQDLLFATIRRPWTMPLSPFTTRIHDYLGNDYFAVSPFDAGVGRRLYLRLHPEHASSDPTGSRRARLAHEVERGHAHIHLEVSEHPFGPWSPLVIVSPERVANVDGEALRFRPFRDGRGMHPRGFIHALRVGVYSTSQRARPTHTA